MGNKFVRALGVKKMEGPAAYFLRLLAIVFVIVLLISFLLMFCEIGFAMGAGFFGFWITKVPAIFVVAYITAAIVFIPSMKRLPSLFQGGLNRMTQEDVYKPPAVERTFSIGGKTYPRVLWHAGVCFTR